MFASPRRSVPRFGQFGGLSRAELWVTVLRFCRDRLALCKRCELPPPGRRPSMLTTHTSRCLPRWFRSQLLCLFSPPVERTDGGYVWTRTVGVNSRCFNFRYIFTGDNLYLLIC